MAKMKTLDDLFLDTLKDVYYAERKILKALPKMKRAAQNEALAAAFDKHHGETQEQIERLQQVFEILGKPARGKTCDAIEGILTEAEDIIEEFKDSPALDAGLISSAQAVEHYEITRYGTLIAFSRKLGHDKKVAELLLANLDQEYAADKSLSELGEGTLNAKAA